MLGFTIFRLAQCLFFTDGRFTFKDRVQQCCWKLHASGQGIFFLDAASAWEYYGNTASGATTISSWSDGLDQSISPSPTGRLSTHLLFCGWFQVFLSMILNIFFVDCVVKSWDGEGSATAGHEPYSRTDQSAASRAKASNSTIAADAAAMK